MHFFKSMCALKSLQGIGLMNLLASVRFKTLQSDILLTSPYPSLLLFEKHLVLKCTKIILFSFFYLDKQEYILFTNII